MSYPHGAPGYGFPGQGFPGQGPVQGIAVTTHFFPLAFMLALFKPLISINGYQVPVVGWGRTVIPMPPGRHRVHVHIPYWLISQLGPADTLVDVYPGRFVELEYKAPVWGFSAGSLGPPPQSFNGVGVTIAVIAATTAFALLLPLLMLLIAI